MSERRVMSAQCATSDHGDCPTRELRELGVDCACICHGMPPRETGAAVHDCAADRCDTDTRADWQVEGEGYAAGQSGVSYEDCPYGHTHPDVRFNPWQRGRWMAVREWCFAHNQAQLFCEGNDDDLIGWPAAEGRCSTLALVEDEAVSEEP